MTFLLAAHQIYRLGSGSSVGIGPGINDFSPCSAPNLQEEFFSCDVIQLETVMSIKPDHACKMKCETCLYELSNSFATPALCVYLCVDNLESSFFSHMCIR